MNYPGFHRLFREIWVCVGLLLALGHGACETLPLGQSSLPEPTAYPSAKEFAITVHPLLVNKCAREACHGRALPFQLSAPSRPFDPSGAPPETPFELPEPFRSDFFCVLYFVNWDNPGQSLLLLQGIGAQPSHPGGRSLSPEDETALLLWLGGTP